MQYLFRPLLFCVLGFPRVAAFAAPGDLDFTFNPPGKIITAIGVANEEANAMAVQSDGRIVLAGQCANGSNNDFAVARYNADGSLDTTFNSTGKVITSIGSGEDIGTAVAVQSDGKIVVAGYYWNGSTYDFAVVRYTAAGALDTTFGSGGKVTTPLGTADDYASAIALQADGKIVVAGSIKSGSDFNMVAVRYLPTGALDATFTDPVFGFSGYVMIPMSGADDEAIAVAIQSDGKILLAGEASVSGNIDFAVARLNPGGSLDTTFDGDGKATTPVGAGADYGRAIVLQPDGKIVVGGRAANASGKFDFAAVRYTTAGALDTAFNSTGKVTTALGVFGESIRGVALQPDGKIVAAGEMNDGSVNNFAVVRYTATGALDSSFNTTGKVILPLGYSSAVPWSVGLQADGKIIAAGRCANRANFDFAFARFNPNGTLDATLNGQAGRLIQSFVSGSDTATCTVVQSDGKVIVGGYLADGTYDKAVLIRFNADGTEDDTFGSYGERLIDFSSAGEIYGLALQPDGKIIATGAGAGYGFVARLLPAGGWDTSFNGSGIIYTAVGAMYEGHAVAVQSDGKIVAAGKGWDGSFADFGVVRLGSNGTLDTSFGSGGSIRVPIGASDDIAECVALQSDGRIVVGGTYHVSGGGFGGSRDDGYALLRLTTAGALDTTFGSGGKILDNVAFGVEDVRTISIQPDGKILAGGSTNSFYSNFMARYTAAGVLDTSFNDSGKLFVSPGSSGLGFVLLPDGKLLAVAGTAQGFALQRYNTNGSADPTFNGGVAVTAKLGDGTQVATVRGAALTGDGRLVLAGTVLNGGSNDFGVARFELADLPSVTTLPASNVSLTAATLNGAVADNLAPATTTFEYGTSTSYGSTASAVAGPGNSFSASLTGLQSNRTYHFRIKAVSRLGTSYGADVTFYSSTIPGVLLSNVSALSSSSGVLNGFVNPNGLSATAQFQYGLTSSYTDTVAAAPSPVTGNVQQSVSAAVSGLLPNTVYHYRLTATNATGTSNTSDGTFTTLPLPPVVTLGAATAITGNAATLTGTVNSNGGTTMARFEYGLTSSYGVTATATLSPDNGTSAQPVSAAVSGLLPATLYHFRLRATNAGGSSSTTEGTFTTSFDVGAPDASFGSGGGVVTAIGAGDDFGEAVAVQADGKVVLAGYYTNGSNDDFAVVRYTATGALDTTFGNGGKVTIAIGTGSDQARAVAIQSDGKIVVAGQTTSGSSSQFALVRLTVDGALDGSFGTGGKVVTSFPGNQGYVYSIAIQPDGKIVAAGSGSNSTAPAQQRFALARYTPAGALDTSFGSGGLVLTAIGSAQAYARSMALQNDGKIVMTGYADAGTYDFAAARYTAAGALDTTFGSGGIVLTPVGTGNDFAYSVAIQGDGKIVVVGTGMVRYTDTGALDTSFGNGGKVLSSGVADAHVAIQSDGKIIVGGDGFNSGATSFAVARYTADGAVDTAFGGGGTAFATMNGSNASIAQTMAVQADGNIVVAGYGYNGNNYDFAVARFVGQLSPPALTLVSVTGLGSDGAILHGTVNPKGTTTTARFEYGLTTSYSASASVMLSPTDGTSEQTANATLSGLTPNTTYHYRLTASNAGGTSTSADATFTTLPLPPVVTMGEANGINPFGATISGTVNPNGAATTAVVEYGTTASYGSTAMVTLSPNNGTNAQAVSAILSGLAGDTLYHFRLKATNAGGTGATSDATFTTGVAPGALDTGFSGTGKTTLSLSGGTDTGRAVAVQTDRKMLVAGYAGTNSDDFAVVRYNVDGTLDATFGSGGKVTTPIGSGGDRGYAMALQADGKIVVTGESVNGGNLDFAVVRYLPTGALDTSFGMSGKVVTPIGPGDDNARCVAVQTDGKIVVGGYSSNGTNIDFALVRYTAAGALDGSFGTGGKVTTAIGSGDDFGQALALQSDGKIVEVGYATNGGNDDFAVVRYTSSGALDTGFGTAGKVLTAVGSGSDRARGVVIQTDGKIVVTGDAANAGNQDFALVRYTSAGALDTSYGTGGKVLAAIGSSDDSGGYAALQPDGKVLVTGFIWNGSNYDVGVARFTTTGALDSTFGTTGKIITPIGSGDDYGRGIAVSPVDGTIVVGGYYQSGSIYKFAVVRYIGAGTTVNNQSTALNTTELDIAPVAGQAETFNNNGLDITATDYLIVGFSGYGTLNQADGMATSADVRVGYAAGSSGVYNLSAGSVSAGNLYLGYHLNSVGMVNQSGGSVSTSSYVTLGRSGTAFYDMSGGTMFPFKLAVGNSSTGSFALHGGTITAGHDILVGTANGGNGTMIHSSGSASAPFVYIGRDVGSIGAYNLSGAGALDAASLCVVGQTGSGTFSQTGGTHSAPTLNVGADAGSSGVYNLTGGILTTGGTTRIGVSGTGTFTQAGGTFSAGTMTIGAAVGGNGTYTLNGGTATVGTLQSGGGMATLTFSRGSLAVASSNLNLGANGLIVGDGVNSAVLELSAGVHTVTNGIHVKEQATLRTKGIPGGSPSISLEGGTLTGDGGQSWNSLAASSGSVFDPAGAATSTVIVSSLALASGATFRADLYGNSCDQLDATGSVDLDGATLTLRLRFAPVGVHGFTVITKSGFTPINGAFAGLPEGAVFSLNNIGPGGGTYACWITYHAGLGQNDAFVRVNVSAPSLIVGEASNVTASAATLSATVNPNGVPLTGGAVTFEYGVTTAYDKIATTAVPEPASSGTTATGVTADLTGLQPNTLYHYRLTASNGVGTSSTADGTFMTAVSGGTWAQWTTGKFTEAELANPAISGGLADPDGDGLTNLLEYAFGSEPKNVDAESGPQLEFNAGHLALSFTRDSSNADLTYTVQAADSLTGTWTDLATSITGGPFAALVNGTSISETGSGTQKDVIVLDPVVLPDPLHPKRFMRVKVSR